MGNGGKMVCQKHARCIFVTREMTQPQIHDFSLTSSGT